MQVATLTLDGTPGPTADLTRDDSGQLWLGSAPVLAVSIWGERVGLTLTEHILLIDADDYYALLRTAGKPAPPE